jgi:hypothetical protein
MKVKPFAFILVCFSALAIAPSKAESGDSVLVGTLRITGETVVGAASGLALTAAMEKSSLFKGGANPYKDERGDFMINLAVDYTAMALGSTIGVYLIGIIGSETGTLLQEVESFGSTFGISALSSLLFFSGCVLPDMLSGFRGYGSFEMDPWGCCTVPLSWGVITIGAVIGFNLTRDYIVTDDSGNHKDQHTPSISMSLVKMRF